MNTTSDSAVIRLATASRTSSGLTAAVEMRRLGVDRVTVLEREQVAGGMPRHTDHMGYGIRDLHRVMRGPAYAAQLAAAATAAGAEVRCGATVIDASGSGVELADGTRLDADAVVVATGVRERPRAAPVRDRAGRRPSRDRPHRAPAAPRAPARSIR